MDTRPSGSPAPGGLMEALRAIGATLNELVRVRGALFAVEWREEVQRGKHMLVLAVLGVALLHMGLVLLTLLIVVAFWDSHRIAAIGTLAAFHLACGAAALLGLRAKAVAEPAPFAASRGELEQDLLQLRT